VRTAAVEAERAALNVHRAGVVESVPEVCAR
jgi:hypothetical protein